MTTKRNRVRTGRRRVGFLEPYRLDDVYMLKPDRNNGRPGIYGGYSPKGDPILVKVWPRQAASNDQDLQEIWRHELRQLHRLAGYPGASACIAHLYDAGYDASGFYLVLATGLRRPLNSLIGSASPGHWLRQPKGNSNRARIWNNLILLARGVETLHSQGLLHRNLDGWAVLTSGTEEPDFQLTGFEWSMRILATEASRRDRATTVQDSFLRDWSMYGKLSAELLGARIERLEDIDVPHHEVAEYLSSEEVTLLRTLIQVQPDGPINGETAIARIEQIVRTLSAERSNRTAKLHIALNLGSGTRLAERIRSAADNEIETEDIDAQLDYVAADLGEAPLLIGAKPLDGGDGLRLILRGRNLSYRLQEFSAPRSNNTTWDMAYCDGTERLPPAPVNVIGHREIEPSSIQLMPLREAIDKYPRLRGKLRSWNEWRREFAAESAPASATQLTHQALSLIQFLEALIAVANTFPVEVLSPDPDESASSIENHVLWVRSRQEPDRDDLARALKLRPPALRLDQELTGERVRPEGWILSESRSLGEKSPTDTEWRFQDVKRVPYSPDIYIFTGARPAAVVREAFLIPEGSVGQDVQFRRRLKALKALSEHDELLRMMSDPRLRVIESHDKFIEDEFFARLDDPKRQALRELTSTLPLYLVQGPPGVGKTRLVRDLVRRRFNDEPTSRVLLTAQSNAAIDHLMDELGAILEKDEKDGPLVVRCSAKDTLDAPSRFDIRLQSRQLITQLARSDLAQQLPSKLRNALSTLATYAQGDPGIPQPDRNSGRTVLGRSAPQALRAFEGAVARAANVVFATTNSGELERLIDERGQCDWAIVEEAGKATGSELVSPMLLSHRRLMIGDHKQLPPFGADQMADLLKSPDSVREALLVGEDFVGRSLRDAAADEIIDEIEYEKEISDDAFPRLCAEALRLLTYFESTIEAEFERQARRRSGRPIAARLTQQHRMHPAIAALVSRCFYARALTTHPDCAANFALPRPFRSLDSERLPLSPIVVIDMPYAQAEIGHDHGDRRPRWHNPPERQAVLQVLSLLEPTDSAHSPPTLAVLSPYSQQVIRLKDVIADVPNVNRFSPPSHSGLICHTVDSFQGSEADIVIVSLVRNNEHSNIQSAFGFLSDIRRMNVLLSRARWQLILITSLSFIGEVLAAVSGREGEHKTTFMREMLKGLNEGCEQGDVSIIPFEQLVKGEK